MSSSLPSIGFSSTSAATTPMFSPPAPPPAPNTPSSSDGPPNVSRSSSLLFGFLVTFLTLFVGFMACGYTSRRAAIDIRRRGRPTAEELNLQWARLDKPLIWDVWIAEGRETCMWKDMMPLSAIVKRPRQEYLSSFFIGGRGSVSRISATPLPSASHVRFAIPHSGSATQEPSSHLLPTAIHNRNSRPSRFSSRARQKREVGEEGTNGEWPEELQISVLIAMPCPPQPRTKLTAEIESEDRGSRQHPLDDGEYEIGIADVHMPRGRDELDLS